MSPRTRKSQSGAATVTGPLAVIEDVEFSAEMLDRFVQFGTYANMTRGVPDVIDGMKPVHRRILWSMWNDVRALPGRKKPKSAFVVGAVMAYHPHGNDAVYATMATMAHVPSEGLPFKRPVSLLEGQGSWGDLREKPAAFRYTECSLTEAALALLGDAPSVVGGSPEVRENAVELVPSYGGDREEPLLLPALFPAYVVNGAKGIGVGVAMDAPSHNLTEVMNLAIRMVDTPNPRLSTILETLPGPDMPCDADVFDGPAGRGVEAYLTTGRGSFVMRARFEVEEYDVAPRRRGRRVVVSTLPYQVAPEDVVEGVTKMVQDGELPPGIDVSNYSTVSGTRVVIDVRELDADDVVRRLLFHGEKSGMQTSFSVNSNAIVEGRIATVSIVDALRHWINHRRVVVRRRTQFRMDRAAERLEIVEGFLVAIPIAEAVVALVRSSENRREASSRMTAGDPLLGSVTFTERQAGAILDLSLSRLTRLGVDEYLDEKARLDAIVAECVDLLSNPAALDRRLKTEMRAVRDRFGYPRRCTLRLGESPVIERPTTPAVEVPEVPGYVVRTGRNWVRWATRASVKPVVGNDHVVATYRVTDARRFEGVSSLGVHYRRGAGELPEKFAKADGLFPLTSGERLVLADSAAPFGEDPSLVLVTSTGGVKRLAHDDWASHKANGKGRPVVTLSEGEEVTHAFFLPARGRDVLLLTARGRVLRLAPETVPTKGRAARTLPAVRLLGDDDRVVYAGAVAPDDDVVYFTATDRLGRLAPSEVRRGSRNTQGMSFAKVSELVVGAVTGSGTTLARFDGSGEEPVRVPLSDVRVGFSLGERDLTAGARGVSRAPAVWLEP